MNIELLNPEDTECKFAEWVCKEFTSGVPIQLDAIQRLCNTKGMLNVSDSGENKHLLVIVCNLIKLRNSGVCARGLHRFLRKFFVSRLCPDSINKLLANSVKLNSAWKYIGDANDKAIREYVMDMPVFHFSEEMLLTSRFEEFDHEIDADSDSS